MQNRRMRRSGPKGATAIVGRGTPKPKYQSHRYSKSQPNSARKRQFPSRRWPAYLQNALNRSEITTKVRKYGVWCAIAAPLWAIVCLHRSTKGTTDL
jgi:hypothetical protein